MAEEETPEAGKEADAVRADPPTLWAGTKVVQKALPAPAVGDRLASFELTRLLGVGGMGTVYEAHDWELDRDVAVKILNLDTTQYGSQWERFIAEARVTAQLEHPSIVPLYSMGMTQAGVVYLVMRKVSGSPLSEVLSALRTGSGEVQERWSRPRLLRAFLQVCEAASYAHARGIIHRDLKPANIMLGEFGETLVLDWGVARRLSDAPPAVVSDTRRNPAGLLVGTPGYMSPEQAAGRPDLDSRSDVWSLGAILYEILTYEPAYSGEQVLGVLLKTMAGLPTIPPLRAPAMGIPDELSKICMKALATKADERFQSVTELAEAVQSFLEGTKRRKEAARHLEHALDVWQSYIELGRTREELLHMEKRFADAADSWAPLSERRELLDVRDTLDDLELRRTRVFGEFIGVCEKALAYLPDHAGARAALAGAYWEKLREAEDRRDASEIAYNQERVSAFDDGTYRVLLEGRGAVSLRTDPPGAEVVCERFEKRGLVYPLVDRKVLGTTPLDQVPLEMGSYLLTIRHPSAVETRYPIRIDRAQHWDWGSFPVRLLGREQIGEGFVYVPAGPFLYGGDADAPGSGPSSEVWLDGFLIAELPVTVEEYIAFLNALHQNDPAEAWRRCPRSESSLSSTEGQYFKRPRRGGRYVLPEVGPDGVEWDPRWPVFGVSWHDAVAYTEWASMRDGVRYRLPREQEREKAARGVDGRFYPWGDRFDRTLCKMGDSRRGPARPEPVGAFPSDVSVYGVRDVAGSMRDWCDDLEFDGDSTSRPVRGGSWNYDPRFCRAACRLGRPPWRIFAYNGFRLAKSV